MHKNKTAFLEGTKVNLTHTLRIMLEIMSLDFEMFKSPRFLPKKNSQGFDAKIQSYEPQLA